MTHELPIRPATGADRGALLALCTEVFDADEAHALDALLDDPRFGPEAFWVAEDGDDVVSFLGLLSLDLRVAGLRVPTGQPEYIGTREGYRHRGLVRRMMALAHERSEARGDLLQLIGGIPYYYRRLGYGWALPLPRSWRLRTNSLPETTGARVRPLTEGDVPAADRWHRRRRESADIWAHRTEAEWHAMLRRDGERPRSYVVERGGQVTGTATVQILDSGAARLSDVAVAGQDDITALATTAVELGQGDVNLVGRRGSAFEAWCLGHGVDFADEIWAWYGRVPDPVALLDHLRPVLDDRLQRSHFAHETTRVPFTTYESGFALEIVDGAVAAVEPCEPDIDPGNDVVGVAPDLLPGFVLGRRGPRTEEQLHPDVTLGVHAGIVHALFPRQTADVTLWF